MAKTNGGWSDLRAIPWDWSEQAASITAEAVIPDESLDTETGEVKQRHNKVGVPRWAVLCMVRARPDDGEHEPVATVPVKVYADEAPVVYPGRPVRFINGQAYPWATKSGSGWSYSADGLLYDGLLDD